LITDSALFTLGGSRAGCEFVLPCDLWPVNVDEDQIKQVIHNIVVNADHAMPDGGTITISAKNIKKSPGSDPHLKPGPYVRIAVSDHGEGIAPGNLSKIFDPFFTTKEKNSGLGLTTAHSIIQKHGGGFGPNLKRARAVRSFFICRRHFKRFRPAVQICGRAFIKRIKEFS